MMVPSLVHLLQMVGQRPMLNLAPSSKPLVVEDPHLAQTAQLYHRFNVKLWQELPRWGLKSASVITKVFIHKVWEV